MTVNKKVKGEMDRIISDPYKCVGEVRGIGGILAGLWRRALLQMNVQGTHFEILLNDFIIKAKKRIPDNRVAKLFTRGNLRREFEKREMTFKVFIKGLKVLKMKHLKITLDLTSNSGKHYTLETSIDLSNNNEVFEFEDMTEEHDDDKETNVN